MRKSNRGMALVVTMVTLTVTLMLGMSSFSSALLGERMSGNYRASMQAHSEAEAGIANASDMLRNPETEGFSYGDYTGDAALEAFLNDMEDGSQLESLASLNGKLAALGGYELSVDPTSIQVLSNSLEFRLISDGSYGAEEAAEGKTHRKAHRKIAGLFSATRRGEVPAGVTSCEGISISGSGTIDSYDSRKGSYGNGNELRSNTTITTLFDGAPITLEGSQLYGKVKATGDLIMKGSSAVIGDVTANGNVIMEGTDWKNEETLQYGRIFGNVDAVGSVNIQGTIQGNVRANKAISFSSESSVNGNVAAPSITYPDSFNLLDIFNLADFVSGLISEEAPGIEAKAALEVCIDLAVPEYRANFAEAVSSCSNGPDCPLLLEGGDRNVVFSESGIDIDSNNEPDYQAYSQNINGRTLSVVRLDSFTQKDEANFFIGEPGNPVDAVMVIDGNTLIEGQGTFKISQGSTLQIVTSGEFYSKNSIQVEDGKPSKEVDGTVVPILSLLSTYRDKGLQESDDSSIKGVQINASSDFHGLVAAPFSQVVIEGGGEVYGAIHGRKVALSGAGAFHYDESLGEMPPLNGDTTPLLIRMSEAL